MIVLFKSKISAK